MEVPIGERNRMADEAIGKYTGLDEDQLSQRLESFLDLYIPPRLSELDLFETVRHLLEHFDDEKKIHKVLLEVTCLHHSFAVEGLLTDVDEEKKKEYLTKFNKLFEILYCAKYGIKALKNIHKKSNPVYDSEININLGFSRFEPIDSDSLKPFQSLLRYLLFSLNEDQYRRQEDYCMKRVVKDGYDTHAWEPVMSIKEYVYGKCQYGVNQNQWINITDSPGNAKNAILYLTNCQDGMHFPDIIKDRKLFSFQNGIYETSIWDDEEAEWVDRWYPFRKERDPWPYISEDLCPHRTAVKYFDMEFIYEEMDLVDWYDIETPHFQGILDYQKFPREVCEWMYIFCGRLLHEVGDLDEWQVMPFLLGKAQTGKSTICTRVIKCFYDVIDVGILSNNIETKFGLSALVDKMVFIGPEINENMKLDQTEFQTIISGEDTQINKKMVTASPSRWTVPGIIAGNNPPGYKDNQGSIGRRLMIFDFNQKVKKGDTLLGKKLGKEIPNLILKCNKAYLGAVNKYKGTDIWQIVPEYFKRTRQIMSEQINSLVHYLSSDKVEYGDELYCELDRFAASFKDYCLEHSFPKQRWIKTFYTGPIEDVGLVMKREKRYNKHSRKEKTCMWLIGLEPKENIESLIKE